MKTNFVINNERQPMNMITQKSLGPRLITRGKVNDDERLTLTSNFLLSTLLELIKLSVSRKSVQT